jgi:hypothetical protein
MIWRFHRVNTIHGHIRRKYLGTWVALILLRGVFNMASAAELQFVPAPSVPGFSFLSWDTEGSVQTKLNLLRNPAGSDFQVEQDGKWVDGAPFVLNKEVAENQSAFTLGTKGKPELIWKAHRTNAGGMEWSLQNVGGAGNVIGKIRLSLPFNPLMAATTILPNKWAPPDGFSLPAVLSAADFGQLLVRSQAGVTGRFNGSRKNRLIDIAFEISAPKATETATLEFTPLQIPLPKGVDEATWRMIRRGWWNVYDPCVRGSDLSAGISSVSPPAGVLANNPVSDPVSSLYLYIADHAMLVPELAPGVSAEYILRYSIEWHLAFRTDPAGPVVAYNDIKDMLDAPASIIVAAWACTEMSNDLKWAEAKLPQLERIADFLASRDIGHDGLVQSPQTGNPNALNDPNKAGSCWDVINSGHKDVYINTVAYRAFCCMADLEKRLQRKEKSERYSELANALRKAFYPTFYNPETQLLTWWISADGKRHDYWAPGLLGLPIAYGLVPKKSAESMLTLIHAKVKEVGFTRLDLGLPCLLTPIRKADYIQGFFEHGSPRRDDGADSFQHYLNGGCIMTDQIWWLDAHARLGLGAHVQPQLSAMVARQAKPVFSNGGSFQNGITNQIGKGAEFFTWTGEPTGYEGHLVYSWLFLQGVFTQQPENLRKILRPIVELSPEF